MIATCSGHPTLWCLIDDVCHWLFPMTFGFTSDNFTHTPERTPWICRVHDFMADAHANILFGSSDRD